MWRPLAAVDSVKRNLAWLRHRLPDTSQPDFSVHADMAQNRDRACNGNNNVSIFYSKQLPSSVELSNGYSAFAVTGVNGGFPSIDWEKFKDSLLVQGFSKAYIKDQMCYGKKYWQFLFNGKFSQLGAEKGCRHALMSLSSLAKFLGCYDWFMYLKRNSGLKWNEKNGDVFSLIYDEQETSGLTDWLRTCREKLEDSAWFTLKWLAYSGLRTGEGYASLEIMRKKGLKGYVNSELGTVEHFRFPRTFIRRTKKVYVTVVDDEMIEELEKWKRKFTYIMLQKRLRKIGLRCRTYDLRKAWGSFMVMNGVPESVVDLCQGRVGKNVFQVSYFRPNMLQVVEQVRTALKKYKSVY